MPAATAPAAPLADLRRLAAARWWALAALAAGSLVLPPLLQVAVPLAPLFAVLAVAAGWNAALHRRLARETSASPGELARQFAFDILALAALLFFSGGATNPLIFLLLPPVAAAALTLPARLAAAIGLLAVAAYSALMLHYLPLPVADPARAARLHLAGMWLTFAVSAAMIGWLILRATALIRERDAELAAAREQALRAERVVALGALAAGAAHELGTPLATLAVVVGELARDPELPEAARADVELMRSQIAACKDIVTGLSRRAGAERLERMQSQPLDRWLEAVRGRWHAIRPQAASRLVLAGSGAPPELPADPTLEQAVANLLNNSANAAPEGEVEIRADWNTQTLAIEVRDRGPGFPPAVLAAAGRTPQPPHAGGSGLGLMLARAAAERLGGRLELANRPDGATARIELPRKA